MILDSINTDVIRILISTALFERIFVISHARARRERKMFAIDPHLKDIQLDMKM